MGAAQVDVARAIAVIAHTGQKYGNKDYFMAHVLPVAKEAMRVSNGDWDTIAIAYLHDVLEDTDLTPALLRRAGVEPVIVVAVERLTRRSDETYDAYIQRIMAGPIDSYWVKLADLTVNLNNNPSDSLRQRYERALSTMKVR